MLIDSPEQGGLQGDVILKFNGRDIDLSSDFPHCSRTADLPLIHPAVGARVEVTVGLLPTREERISRASGPGTTTAWVSWWKFAPQLQDQLSLEDGVVVRRVIDGLLSAGIRHGDVITNIDGETIRNVNPSQKLFEIYLRIQRYRCESFATARQVSS